MKKIIALLLTVLLTFSFLNVSAESTLDVFTQAQKNGRSLTCEFETSANTTATGLPKKAQALVKLLNLLSGSVTYQDKAGVLNVALSGTTAIDIAYQIDQKQLYLKEDMLGGTVTIALEDLADLVNNTLIPLMELTGAVPDSVLNMIRTAVNKLTADDFAAGSAKLMDFASALSMTHTLLLLESGIGTMTTEPVAESIHGVAADQCSVITVTGSELNLLYDAILMDLQGNEFIAGLASKIGGIPTDLGSLLSLAENKLKVKVDEQSLLAIVRFYTLNGKFASLTMQANVQLHPQSKPNTTKTGKLNMELYSEADKKQATGTAVFTVDDKTEAEAEMHSTSFEGENGINQNTIEASVRRNKTELTLNAVFETGIQTEIPLQQHCEVAMNRNGAETQAVILDGKAQWISVDENAPAITDDMQLTYRKAGKETPLGEIKLKLYAGDPLPSLASTEATNIAKMNVFEMLLWGTEVGANMVSRINTAMKLIPDDLLTLFSSK